MGTSPVQFGSAQRPIARARRKEAEMFIGEIEEIGVIEPLVVPEVVPAEREHETEPAEPRRIEEPVPAG